MVVPIERLLNVPIMSLQTGAELAMTDDVIIDPRNLSIAAFRVKGTFLDDPNAVLHPTDIREFGEMGFIVNDSDVLMSPEGLVRLEEVMGFNFRLIDKMVIDERKHKLGRVADYTVNPDTYEIEQLFTKQTLLRSINSVGNIIRRSQIINVTDNEIIVSSPTIPVKAVSESSIPQAFSNPFRQARPEMPEN